MNKYYLKDRLHYLLFGCPLCQPKVESATEKLPDCVRRTKTLYIHIPKAGGSSISMGLYGRQIGHWTFREWEAKYGSAIHELTTFSVLREPVSRFISAFWFLKEGGMNELDQNFANTHLSKYESPQDLALDLLDPPTQGNVLSYFHFRPQFEFICNEDFGVSIDYLISLENMREGLDVMFGAEGFSFDVPRLNEGSRAKGSVTELSGEGLDILHLIYRDDFAMYERISTSK